MNAVVYGSLSMTSLEGTAYEACSFQKACFSVKWNGYIGIFGQFEFDIQSKTFKSLPIGCWPDSYQKIWQKTLFVLRWETLTWRHFSSDVIKMIGRVVACGLPSDSIQHFVNQLYVHK